MDRSRNALVGHHQHQLTPKPPKPASTKARKIWVRAQAPALRGHKGKSVLLNRGMNR